METFLEILKFTIPSAIMIVGVVIMMNKLFRQEGERRVFEIKRMNSNVVVPAKMRAYERLVMFLERITPESMFGRFNITGLNNIQLQQMLVQAVRNEFEHNLSQQIYIGEDAWLMVKNARESIVQFINACAAKCEPSADAMQLATVLLEAYSNLHESPIQLALRTLHREFQML
jgi:hypothetical protein